MARCVEAIAEHDLGRAAETLGICLHLFRKDLMLMSIALDLDLMSTVMSTTKEGGNGKSTSQNRIFSA